MTHLQKKPTSQKNLLANSKNPSAYLHTIPRTPKTNFWNQIFLYAKSPLNCALIAFFYSTLFLCTLTPFIGKSPSLPSTWRLFLPTFCCYALPKKHRLTFWQMPYLYSTLFIRLQPFFPIFSHKLPPTTVDFGPILHTKFKKARLSLLPQLPNFICFHFFSYLTKPNNWLTKF